MAQTIIVYLKRPRITAPFSLTIVQESDDTARMEGPDLERVAKFLRGSQGVPQFDLEFEGRQFNDCHSSNVPSTDAIRFAYSSVTILQALKSDPNASYP